MEYFGILPNNFCLLIAILFTPFAKDFVIHLVGLALRVNGEGSRNSKCFVAGAHSSLVSPLRRPSCAAPLSPGQSTVSVRNYRAALQASRRVQRVVYFYQR